LAEQFTISLYLVEYPFANGAFGQVSFSSNCLKFNGYDCFSFTISETTELARCPQDGFDYRLEMVWQWHGASKLGEQYRPSTVGKEARIQGRTLPAVERADLFCIFLIPVALVEED
jgi:hypothetical protein